MDIDLHEYLDNFECRSHVIDDVLETSYNEAARVMSPLGVKTYLDGAVALCRLGKGEDMLVTFLEEMPLVAKEVGEEVVGDIVIAAMKMASQTSGTVIALMLSSMPLAAKRLGDADLVRGYIDVLQKMMANAPRGMRPMLEHLDLLLSKLTLGGLRRWIMYGAETYRRDFKQQMAYFNLESQDALSILERERRGTLFVDTHRKLSFYLRAFWNRDFFLRPTSGDFENREGYRPYIDKGVIHIPDAYDDDETASGLERYRATCAHAAAHIAYTTSAISAEGLNPLQMAAVAQFEDARIEAKAIGEFPGLRDLWKKLHPAPTANDNDMKGVHPFIQDLMRLSRALLDDSDYDPGRPYIKEWVQRFKDEFVKDPDNNQIAWDLGVTFMGRVQSETGVTLSAAAVKDVPILYRDDNRIIWEFAEIDWEAEGDDYVPASMREQQVRKQVSLMELVNEIDSELTGGTADEIWVYSEELFPYEDEGVSYNEMEGKEPVSPPYHYPEWDYQVQVYRPDWATVYERRQGRQPADVVNDILLEYKPVASRLKRVIDMLQPQGMQRLKKQEEGDELDIDAAISAMVDLRMGTTPDQRINIQHKRHTRDVSVLLLTDMSESTNEFVRGSDKTVLRLTQEATSLLSWAIDGIGDNFAIHGFASDSRHDVQYYRYKDFGMPWDDFAKQRVAGMRGGLSTRMGAAMRHAGNHHLLRQGSAKKLLLVLTDGEPADIDVQDPQHLRFDTKKAVEELNAKGIMTYCITLDPNADSYVKRIFGEGRYTVVDNVERLPERLPNLFMSLTK